MSGYFLPYTNGTALAREALPVAPYIDFSSRLSEKIAAGATLLAYFALPYGTKYQLIALLSAADRTSLEIGSTQVGETFPSLANEIPQIQLFEREIAEQYGIVPQGHPWLKPVRFHRAYTAGKDAWQRTAAHPIVGDMLYYRTEGHDIHEVAVGPVHAGVIEPGHFRFQCYGEEVFHLEISLGYQHRGVEQLLTSGMNTLNLWRAQTIAGDTTIGHATAWCVVYEALRAQYVQDHAWAVRSIALELERLANHVGDIGGLATDVGFLLVASFNGRLRGDYLNITAALCGNRFGRGLLRVGGTNFSISSEKAERLLRQLQAIQRDTFGSLDLFFETPSVLGRLERVGVVPEALARQIGLVGVAARASGLAGDARIDFPLHELCALPPERQAQEKSGDVFARANIRRQEIATSIERVQQLLENLPPEEEKVPLSKTQQKNAIVCALTEGWRGVIVHIGITDARGAMERYKVVDPSFHNWNGLAMALRNEEISDFPLCNKSFNLSYCGFDL